MFKSGNEFLELLGQLPSDTELTWLPKVKEHKLEVGKMSVFYPSLKSLRERLDIAEEMGAGVAIWEMGQGLDYFYDLL